MKLNTASQVISFARKLEEDGASLYESLAEHNAKDREVLLGFAKENKRNLVQVERAYYGVITDAIEGCFTFDIDSNEYAFNTNFAKKARYSDALSTAIDIEGIIVKFYSEATEQSKSLLADVARVFSIMAKKRDDRGQKLASLLEKKD